ncbi:MAG: ASCH domain-containing protein [Gemmataceae bacterium]
MLYHALSLKQPWAALLAAGVKTVEVRRWTTSHRGQLLIHAARVPDDRPEAWACVPDGLREAARQEGGVVGVGTLESVKAYRAAEAFAADRPLHLNEPAWFEPRGLFGFVFTGLHPLPYHQVPGYVRVFRVELDGLDLPGEAEPAGLVAVWRRFRRLARSLGKEE